jgi:hypothetical protein
MLPNAEHAILEPSRVRDYLLSAAHPVGRFKAAVFIALGYSQEDWQVPAHDILALATTGVAHDGQLSEFGKKYEVSGKLIGPNGRTATFTTVWMVKQEESMPRFITAFPGQTMYKLLDTVALTHDIQASGLRTGDLGAIVKMHGPEAM